MNKKIVFVLIISVCVSFFVMRMVIAGAEKEEVPNNKYIPHAITCGEEQYVKPGVSNTKLIVESVSFCENNMDLTVKVGIGDSYAKNLVINAIPNRDIYGINGYPILKVYDAICNEYNEGFLREKHNSLMKINNVTSEPFIKKYTKDEMDLLDTSVSNGKIVYYESISVSFNNMVTESTGGISLVFGWFFEDANPNNGKEKTIGGISRTLYYYKGELGAGLSFDGVEDAKKNYQDAKKEIQRIEPDDFCSSKELMIIPNEDNKNMYPHGSEIKRSYQVTDSINATKVIVNIVVPEHVSLFSKNCIVLDNLDMCFSIDFSLDDSFVDGQVVVDVIAYDEKENEISKYKKTIFLLNENDFDYISDNSYDDLAIYSEKVYKSINDIDMAGECFKYGQTDLKLQERGQFEVKGTIYWKDVNGTSHPARSIRVEIYHSGSSTPIVTNTNGYGSFDKTWTGSSSNETVYIKVLSKGLYINVKDSSGVDYCYQTSTYSVSAGTPLSISYTAANNTNKGKSVGVHQSLELANRYMYSIDGTYLSNLNVSFPDSSHGTSCFLSSQNTIYILYDDAVDWDVMEHEYGHYVQKIYGLSGSPGGSHSMTQNLADTLGNKSDGINLAWGEGWATYYAINLQNKMSASSLNIPNVGDTRYQDTVDASINTDIEILASNMRLGEANEATVAAVLYDITDGINASENDNVQCNNTYVWSLTKTNQCKSLSAFINAFNNSSSINTQTKINLGAILSLYKVSSALEPPSGTVSTPMTFSWIAQGGSINYPNNSFRLAFYDSSYNLILRTSYGSSLTRTPTTSQWNQIISSGGTVTCCVESRQTGSPVTGPYYSNSVLIVVSSSGIYTIKNTGTGKFLNIYGNNVTTLSNHQNVCLWSGSGTNEQKWYVSSVGSGVFIKSIIDYSYGLNVYRTGNPWNCDLFPVSGNETDAMVDFISVNGGYRIKLHNYDLYLSSSSSSNGSNVYWNALSSGLYQIWSLTSVP